MYYMDTLTIIMCYTVCASMQRCMYMYTGQGVEVTHNSAVCTQKFQIQSLLSWPAHNYLSSGA